MLYYTNHNHQPENPDPTVGTPFAENLDNYERVLVFVNPKSTRAGLANARLDMLKTGAEQQKLGFTRLETEPYFEANIETLQENLTDGDILAVSGGDGTLNQMMRAALELDAKNPVLTIAGGNANDIARALHKKRYIDNPTDVLSNSSLISLHPLKITTWQPYHSSIAREKGSRTAFSYFTVGATALAAMRINQPDYRQSTALSIPIVGRQAKEKIAAVKAYIDSKPMRIFTENGHHEALDIMAVNGPFMAKNFRFPAELHDRQGRLIEISQKWPPANIRHIGQLLLGQLRGAELEDSTTFTVYSDKSAGIFAQADGEPMMFTQGTSFSISRHPKSLSVLSTRHH